MTADVVILTPRNLKQRDKPLPVFINAAVYRQLGPIASRQGLTVQGLVNRVMEGVTEEYAYVAGEVRADG